MLGLVCGWDKGRNQLLGLVFALGELVVISWGPWMGFKGVLGSQWWRVGPKISLIISRGFQMKIPKLGNFQERSTVSIVPCLVPTA